MFHLNKITTFDVSGKFCGFFFRQSISSSCVDVLIKLHSLKPDPTIIKRITSFQIKRLFKPLRPQQGRPQCSPLPLPRGSRIAQQEGKAAHEEERRPGKERQRHDRHRQPHTSPTSSETVGHRYAGCSCGFAGKQTSAVWQQGETQKRGCWREGEVQEQFLHNAGLWEYGQHVSDESYSAQDHELIFEAK